MSTFQMVIVAGVHLDSMHGFLFCEFQLLWHGVGYGNMNEFSSSDIQTG